MSKHLQNYRELLCFFTTLRSTFLANEHSVLCYNICIVFLKKSVLYINFTACCRNFSDPNGVYVSSSVLSHCSIKHDDDDDVL